MSKLSSNEDMISKEETESSRWTDINFGLIKTIYKVIFVNISEKVAGTLTILTTIILSISDTISDIIVAVTLFSMEEYILSIIVFAVDFIPCWTLVAHNLFSSKWRKIMLKHDKWTTVIALFLSPFSNAIFHIRWLWRFESSDAKLFNLLHHNARLSQLLGGSYESPIQVMILLYLWGTQILELPWAKETCITDSRNRRICMGAFPGMFSFTISILSIIKSSLDISEGLCWHEKLTVLVYAMCNYLFRLPSLVLAVLYFDEWSILIIVPVLILNFILILRYDRKKRKEFSITTSVLVSSIIPFVSSDQANLYQVKDVTTCYNLDELDNKYRRKLSAKMSMASFPLLLISDMVLFVMLKYRENFTYNEDIVMDKTLTEDFILLFLIPLGGFLFASNVAYLVVITPQYTKSNYYYGAEYITSILKTTFKIKMKRCIHLVMVLLILSGVVTLIGSSSFILGPSKGKRAYQVIYHYKVESKLNIIDIK